MQTDQLDYIIEVAKTGSISGAAHNLHVSTATISQSISNFEEKYGVKIFTRSRMGSKLTDRGKIIIEKVYEIKHKIMELELEASSQQFMSKNELKLVSSPSVLLTILPKAISNFNKIYPNTKVKIVEEQDVIENILNNENEIGFISVDEMTWIKSGNIYKDVLHFDTLFQGRMYVCVGKDSPLSFKESITPEELLDQTFIMHQITKPIYDDILNQYGEINILFESSNTEIIKKTISEGIGISILSEFSLNSYASLNDEIIAIPLVNYERSNLTCGYVRPKKKVFSETARNFLKLIQEQIKNGEY